ncbi:MAG: DUF1574 family protein [Gemmataceae bacterium]
MTAPVLRGAVAGPPVAHASGPPRRATAKRAVLWGVALFALTQLFLGVTAELYPRLRDPLYGDKLVKLQRKLAAPDRRATVVMLGSSRTGLAFHGKRVEAALPGVAAFNYGVPASGPVTHLIYLDRLLAAGIKPDLLLVEVLPSMLADRADAPLERNWLYADRLTHGELDTVIQYGFDPAAVRRRWAESVLLPAYALRFQLMSRISASWLPWQVRFDWSRGADECGWGEMIQQQVTAADRTLGFARAKLEYEPVLANWHPGGPAVAALRELVARCKDRGVPVALVLMPEGTDFRALYPPAAVERLTAFMTELSKETGVPVVNAREWLPDAGFHDGHHMLTVGANEFTDRMTREVIAPRLK